MIQSVTIGGTINLGNYESLRLDVCADTAGEALNALRDCLKGYAMSGSPEEELIKCWGKRVLGGSV
jgi:hypothetical protein